MRYTAPLIEVRLLRRYKRFLADVRLDTGEEVTAHTSNPGRMQGVSTPGSRVYLSFHDNPKRKLKYTWELIEVDDIQTINLRRTNISIHVHLHEVNARVLPTPAPVTNVSSWKCRPSC